MRQCLRRQLQPIEHDDADAVRSLAEIEPELEPEKMRVALVDRGDSFRHGACDRPRQANAEDRIDDDVGCAQTVQVPAADAAAGGEEIVVRAARVALQFGGLAEAYRDDLQ